MAELTILSAILLGIIQGVTEFLPISSSGHLALVQQLIGIEVPLLFDIFLHVATLMAVVKFFWSDILSLRWKEIKVLLVATLPLFGVGAVAGSYVETLFAVPAFVALMLAVTGLLNWRIAAHLKNKQQPVFPDLKSGLKVGFAQAVAILPGVSRSGMTLWATRPLNFSFAFLLSLPAISGAFGYQLLKTDPATWQEVISLPYLIGGVAAFLAGLASLYFLKKIIASNGTHFRIFAVYCWIVSIMVLMFQ